MTTLTANEYYDDPSYYTVTDEEIEFVTQRMFEMGKKKIPLTLVRTPAIRVRKLDTSNAPVQNQAPAAKGKQVEKTPSGATGGDMKRVYCCNCWDRVEQRIGNQTEDAETRLCEQLHQLDIPSTNVESDDSDAKVEFDDPDHKLLRENA